MDDSDDDDDFDDDDDSKTKMIQKMKMISRILPRILLMISKPFMCFITLSEIVSTILLFCRCCHCSTHQQTPVEISCC